MDLHRQTCQNCGGTTHRLTIVRHEGETDKVFVKCADCGEFVARYTIAQRGYYHHGKGFESYLKGMNRGGVYESARDLAAGFDVIVEKAKKEFDEVEEELKRQGKGE